MRAGPPGVALEGCTVPTALRPDRIDRRCHDRVENPATLAVPRLYRLGRLLADRPPGRRSDIGRHCAGCDALHRRHQLRSLPAGGTFSHSRAGAARFAALARQHCAEPFAQLNLLPYSPLCLLAGAGFLMIAFNGAIT